MSKIGIGIDYSNICKDYNTAYLDRDNKDPETAKCMRAVVTWMRQFLLDLVDTFDYQIFPLNDDAAVKIDDVASNRFLFYSLEKEITLQSFVVQKAYVRVDGLAAWGDSSCDGCLIQNDEDGEGVYLYFDKNGPLEAWIRERLEDFSIDEVPFQGK